MKWDAVITGGGLAGLALCLDLKRRGYAVAVVEKGSYPRQKVCGEYISMESWRYLHELCPALGTLSLPHITNFKLSSLNNSEFTTPLGLGGFGISRYLLEELLYKEALNKGVFFLLDTKVSSVKMERSDVYTIHTNSQDLTAKLVCNASGRRSNLEMNEKGKRKSGTNYIGVKYHVHLTRDPKLIEIHNFSGGYCGISNIEEDKSCLCYIVNAKQLAQNGRSIIEMEKKILFQNKNLEHIFTKAEFLTKEPVTISGINFFIKEPLNQNSFFLGDAAGSIAPITGNGMSMALRSAFVLADNIDRYFSAKQNKQELENQYRRFWKREFSTRIQLSRYFQKLSEFPLLTRTTIGVFRLFPPLAKGVIRLTHGKPF